MGYFDRCHLPDSGESLSALWIGRYPDSGDQRKRVLGVPRCPEGPNVGKPRKNTKAQQRLRDGRYPIYPVI